MCGIAGALDLTGVRDFSPQRLLAMTGAIAHRGPDDEHFHLEPGLALGARRLAIIDLAGGRQPISNEDGSIWVAFNGELFEYPKLRHDLLAAGHQLATRCDTEAWVHLYEDFGQAMFERARGQFAVSLWDRNDRTLILGRDRIGICPLYYAQADGWLLWGSEIRALLASGLFTARPDPRGIDHFFTFFGAGTTRTCFEGVKSLPPGHFLKIHDGRLTQHQYWDLDFPDVGMERRLDDPSPLISEFEEILRRAVGAAGYAVMSRSSATSAEDSIPQLCSGFATSSGLNRSRLSPLASTELGLMSGCKPPKRPEFWARHFLRWQWIEAPLPRHIPNWYVQRNAPCSIPPVRPFCG